MPAIAPSTGPDATTTDWDREQTGVIRAEVTARLLVDAGPGTGKTAVACARVAWLIDHAELEPNSIWLVSFTQTAVHELRSRIGSYLTNPNEAAGIRIATIDAHSWAIQSGFNHDVTMSGSYEDNIKKVIELIENHDGVFGYLSQVKHLLVDEAQDVVGARVQLMLELINALPREAGVTVLSDEAQGIYGFAEDQPAAAAANGTLPENIRRFMANDFTEMELLKIYRTGDPTLQKVFSSGRALLRNKTETEEKKLQGIRDLIQQANHGLLDAYGDDLKNLPDDLGNSFLLFRRRGEALQASGYLGMRPHRLRMSGLPPMIHAWICLMFWNWIDSEITESVFRERWLQKKIQCNVTVDEGWSILVRLVGESQTRISVRKLAQRLANGSPPIDLCMPDFGFEGPLIGTIHGAKGREADQVRLYMPAPSAFGQGINANNILAEARILFVGASRARKQLLVSKAATLAHPRRLMPSGRAYTPFPFSDKKSLARSMVEIGRINDIDAPGLSGKSFFSSSQDVTAAQARIAGMSGNHRGYGEGDRVRTKSDVRDWRPRGP
ncbi:UvrD-helicase domain-containing protein [Undibacterium arcticum]|uniref:UvrD-helicase domain-containing protein n=1 Tax=Undibacterium arcticum TaxID=1762892 RepID=UPI00361FEB6A